MVKNSLIPGFLWDGAISGHATSIISILAIDTAILQPLLPGGLVLGPQNVVPAPNHPVYFSFNIRQQNVTTPIPFLKLNYAEFAFGIPYVQLINNEAEDFFAYSPILYLNSILATIGGRFFYSLPKKYSKVTIKDSTITSFEACHFFNHRKLYLSSNFNNDGPAAPGHTMPNYLRVLPMLQQPLIVFDRVRGFRSTNYAMQQAEQLLVQPMTGEGKTGSFLPGLNNFGFNTPGIGSSTTGTFKIDYNWQLTKTIRV